MLTTAMRVVTLADILEENSGEKAGFRYLTCCAFILGRYREKPLQLELLRGNLRLLVETVTLSCVETVVDDLVKEIASRPAKTAQNGQLGSERFDPKRLSDDAYESLGVFQCSAIDELQKCVMRKPPIDMCESDEYRIRYDDCKIGLMMATLFDLESYAISAIRKEFFEKNPIFGQQ